MFNAITLIDGYKLDHRRQYPAGTEFVYSNWTPRVSRIKGIDKVVNVGLQYFLQEYLGNQFNDTFFDRDVEDVVAEYNRRTLGYLGPNEIGDQHIRDLHALGYLPLEFKALPEGALVPLRVPMFTVENTHPDFFWLVNYIETLMSNVLWMPMTSATIAKRMRGLLDEYAVKTGSPKEFVDWQGHDFSMRGMAGVESAVLSGFGHLTQFTGTDTIPAIDFIETYYPVLKNSDDGFDFAMDAPGWLELDDTYLIGGSVAATEHSVMCAGGEDDERETYERLIDLYPSGILSVVSDTWDLWKVVTETVPSLKDKILARDGKLVIRPDSGDPADILCGMNTRTGKLLETIDYSDAESKGVVELLWETFGGIYTETGHKLLDSHIGVIYGDSINYERAKNILERLDAKGFASANVVFGMGSFGYQYQTRDTFGFAMKATNVVIDGVEKPIFKNPVTDGGTKKSLRGRIAVLRNTETGEYYAVDDASEWALKKSELTTVWKNGEFVERTTIKNIRDLARG
jgi:nicotinamide phosphoribosyltransferase